MKATDKTVDYYGEHLGVRVAAERCQALVRDYDKNTWSIYGAPDSYPQEQKYWTSANGSYSIVRMAVHVLRNEMQSDLLDVLTGRTGFDAAKGCRAVAQVDRALAKRKGAATVEVKASAAKVGTPVPARPKVMAARRAATPSR